MRLENKAKWIRTPTSMMKMIMMMIIKLTLCQQFVIRKCKYFFTVFKPHKALFFLFKYQLFCSYHYRYLNQNTNCIIT